MYTYYTYIYIYIHWGATGNGSTFVNLGSSRNTASQSCTVKQTVHPAKNTRNLGINILLSCIFFPSINDQPIENTIDTLKNHSTFLPTPTKVNPTLVISAVIEAHSVVSRAPHCRRFPVCYNNMHNIKKSAPTSTRQPEETSQQFGAPKLRSGGAGTTPVNHPSSANHNLSLW